MTHSDVLPTPAEGLESPPQAVSGTKNTFVFRRNDWLIALLLALFVFVLYVRTLAPGLLYGDSGEFQVLPYTMGLAHVNGYPIYLLAARAFSLIPIGSLAWRISLFSAFCAGLTVGGVYLLAFGLSRSRIGAALGTLALAISYTFWSQAVIAEVYTFATAVLVVILLLLGRWATDPVNKPRRLFWIALLIGMSPGIHYWIPLMAPAIGVLVFSGRLSRKAWRGVIWNILGGGALGVAVFVGTFLLMDAHNSLTSYQNVVMSPSRSIWNLTEADMDTPLERLWLSVSAPQWHSVFFPSWLNMGDEIDIFLGTLTTQEFSMAAAIGALFGLLVMLARRSRLEASLLVMLFFMLFLILNYEPGDKYIFFLPIYILLMLALAVAVGTLLDWGRRLAARVRPGVLPQAAVSALVGVVALVLILAPFWGSRLDALKSGCVDFVNETYVLPLDASSLEEPEAIAHKYLDAVPDNALLVLDWRALYVVYYVAHFEQKRTGIHVVEAAPFGSEEQFADSMVAFINDALAESRPVYTDYQARNLYVHFKVRRVPGSGLVELLPKANN